MRWARSSPTSQRRSRAGSTLGPLLYWYGGPSTPGPQTPTPTVQSLGGEDFAWYLQAVPGAMARLGTRTPGGATYDLHQGDLVVDERAVAIGARLLLGVATTHRPD